MGHDLPRFNATLVPPPYAGVVIVHSSAATRTMIEQLVELRPAGERVVQSVATIEEAKAALAVDGRFVAIVENDLEPGGALALVASGVRGGARSPVISLTDGSGDPVVPYGFCQAVARLGGDNHELADALAAVLAGATYLGADRHHQRTPVSPSVDAEPLTMRETEMLREIAFGNTSKQVAVTHLISSETVKTHVANILRKLGASTRAHAVAIGYERGLLGATPPLLIKSTFVWTRHGEAMIYDTFAHAAADVLRYLFERCGFDSWLLTETIDGHCVSLESQGAMPDSILKSNEDLCTLIDAHAGLTIIEDIRSYDLDSRERPAFERLGIRAFVAVPIARDANGGVLATMCAFSSEPLEQPLGPDQLARINETAELLAAMVPGDVS